MLHVKIYGNIIYSTVWARADHSTRIVWFTLLAMADEEGTARASVPGLANLARVTVEECERALEFLSSPDPHAKGHVDEGRQIRRLPEGGWQLVNTKEYREIRTLKQRRTAANVRRYRARSAG